MNPTTAVHDQSSTASPCAPSTGPHPPTADIRLGDALEVLKTLEDASVHSVVTDPPYALTSAGAMLGQVNQNYHATESHGRGYADHDATHFTTWCTEWATECLRILKPGGHLIAFGGTRTYHQLATSIETAGFDIRDQLIWAHGRGTFRGRNLQNPHGERTGWVSTPTPAHEPAALARKPFTGTLENNFAAHGTGALNGEATRYGTTTSKTVKTRALGNLALDDDLAAHLNPRTGGLFFIPKPDATERVTLNGIKHPTVKPLHLMRTLVRFITPPAGTVLDPFAGSGTTLEAALLEGMSCIAIEQEPTYHDLIHERLHRSSP